MYVKDTTIIYKYTKGSQSTEICETDRNSDTGKTQTEKHFFFLLGLYVWTLKPQRHG